MGKKGGFFAAIKKALHIDSKKSENSKKKNGNAETGVAVTPPKELERTENDHSMRAYSVAIATAAAAEAAAAAARAAAAEVARLTATVRQSGILKEEAAAVKIQCAFRGHLARRKLRALRGLARLKSMIKGQSVQRQSMIALQCMQTLSRVQSQVRSSRIKMSDVNMALQQQLQNKCEKEFDKLRAEQLLQQKCDKDFDKSKTSLNVDGDWNSSAASKEQIEAKLQNKEEAAKKRERALAYAYTHQRVRRNPLKTENTENMENPTITAQTDPFWGWSWLERWMATRPWENKTIQDRQVIVEQDNNNASSMSNLSPKPKPPLSTPLPKARSVGPKTRATGSKSGPISVNKSDGQRRHTIGGSLVKDDDKKVITKTVSSEAVKVMKSKSNVASRLGNGKTDKSFGSAKKQLSYSTSSPGVRRHSGPPKVDGTS